jgi:hypothetical protein
VYGCGNNQLGEIGRSDLVNIQIESGNQATQFAPYSNECPITGWTGCEVQRTGKNLFDGSVVTTSTPANWGVTWDDTTATLTIEHKNTYSTGTPFCRLDIPPGTYTIKCASAIGAFEIRKNGAYLIQCNTTARQFTVEDGDVCVAYFYNANMTTFVFKEIQLELSSTATPYEPYTGRSITIDLGQTVYGGKMDVLSGVMTVDRAMVDLGTLNWTYNSTYYRFSTSGLYGSIKPSDNAKKGNIVCSHYKTDAANNTAYSGYDNIIGVGSKSVIVIRDTSYTDETAFKQMLTDANVQLVYELAEPIEIQLTPNQVNSLLGVNNIWADTGDTNAEYRADTRLYIEKLTQPEEDDMIADSAITSGQFFMIGNSLYRALTAIASGATITVGTNAERVSLSDALNLVNA